MHPPFLIFFQTLWWSSQVLLRIQLISRAVVCDHGEAVIVHVEDNILANHCQTDERQIALGFRHVRCRASKKGFRMLC